MQAAPLLPSRPARPRFQRLRVITALALRGMDTKFGRSAGGYLWAVAEPLGGIVLLALVFSLAVRSPPIGTSFMLFYATGVIPFRMFNAMSGAVSSAISANRGLLAYPVVKPLDAVFARFALNFMTDFLVATLLFVGIIRFTGLTVNLDLAAIAGAFTLTALLGLGIGTLNCVLFGLYPTWKNFWSVLTRPLFFLSGIFFLFESVPTAVPRHRLVQSDRASDRPDAGGVLRQLPCGLRLGPLRARDHRDELRPGRLPAAAARHPADRGRLRHEGRSCRRREESMGWGRKLARRGSRLGRAGRRGAGRRRGDGRGQPVPARRRSPGSPKG